MRLSSLGYLLKQGWKSMAANRLMTFASIGVLTACLIITGLASLVSLNVNRIVTYMGSQTEITVYLEDNLSDEQKASLRGQIEAIDNVTDVRFVSREEAHAEMQEWMDDKADLITGLESIFPEQYRVTVADPELMEQSHAQIRTMAGVDDTAAASEVADIMVSIRNAVTYGGWGLVVVLAIVSIIVISNTIRITVFARRREISIMKYVGATNAFIRMPFFIEGMTVGALAGALAAGLVSAAYHLVYNWITGGFNVFVLSLTSNIMKLEDIWGVLLVCFIAFGVLIGGLGSATSVKKHLKV